MEDIEKIKERIRKLLKLASAKGATDAEAKAAFAKASELFLRHKIERGELDDEREGVVNESRSFGFDFANYRYATRLACVIEKQFRCYILCGQALKRRKGSGYGKCICFFGFADDAEIAKVVFENAFCRIENFCRGRGVNYRKFYGLGFTLGLKEQFDKLNASDERFSLVLKTPERVIAVAEAKVTDKRVEKSDVGSRGFRVDAIELGKKHGRAWNPHGTITSV